MKVVTLSHYAGESIVKCDCGHKFYMTLDPYAKQHPWEVRCPGCGQKKKLTY